MLFSTSVNQKTFFAGFIQRNVLATPLDAVAAIDDQKERMIQACCLLEMSRLFVSSHPMDGLLVYGLAFKKHDLYFKYIVRT